MDTGFLFLLQTIDREIFYTKGISTDEAKELGTFMQKSIDKLNRAAHMGLLGGVKTA